MSTHQIRSDADLLGALRPWSDAAARLLGKDPARWRGYEFTGIEGKGMDVTGRVGRYGKVQTVYVPLSEMPPR